MSVVQQVIQCPVCAASRKPEFFYLDERGNLLPRHLRVDRLLVLKIQNNLGNRNIIWKTYPLPIHALQAFVKHLETTLEFAKKQLAEQSEED